MRYYEIWAAGRGRSFVRVYSRNTTLANAKTQAGQYVKFGPFRAARVFVGKRVGKLAFQVVGS